jgi:hypothetical protein
MRNRSQGSAADCDPASRYGADYIVDMHRCCWDCLRVCLPEGSRLTVATPAPLPEASLYHRRWGGAGRKTLTIGPHELGKQVFAVYLGAQSMASDPVPTEQRGPETTYR